MAGVTLRRACGGLARCGVLAAAMVAGSATSAELEFRPAPRSALQTLTEPRFAVARGLHDGMPGTLIARQRAGELPLPVMRLAQKGVGSEAWVAIQRLHETADDLATLEQLYVLLMRQDPLARYCFAEGSVTCDAAATGLSHPQALEVVAARRERAAAGVAGAIPWRTVEMHGARRHPGDLDLVGVAVLAPQGPLQQARLYFNRAPHSICGARTGDDGWASCRLEDQHGDGDQHDHATSVVVTYPGEVRPDRVLLPTTYVLPAPPTAPAPPAFARPLTLPSGWPAAFSPPPPAPAAPGSPAPAR